MSIAIRRHFRGAAAALLMGALVAASLPPQASMAAHSKTIASRNMLGELGNSTSRVDRSANALSADGRFVAYQSHASNLVEGDTNDKGDVFVRDGETGYIERVSVSADGDQANEASAFPAISGDGRWVAFSSHATNLVDEEIEGGAQVYLRDRAAGRTELISMNAEGVAGMSGAGHPSPVVSDDGRYVAFVSDATNLVAGDGAGLTMFLKDRQTGSLRKIADTYDSQVQMSADGRRIVFSSASALVPADVNAFWDVYLYNVATETFQLMSVGTNGNVGNHDSYFASISADGRVVAFSSGASNLVPNDTNALYQTDVFVRDRTSGTTTRVSVSSSGQQSAGAYGADDSGESYYPDLSANGRYVVYQSYAGNLVEGDDNHYWDIFVHDNHTGATQRISSVLADEEGGQAPFISRDGRLIAFETSAPSITADPSKERHVALVHFDAAALEPVPGASWSYVAFGDSITTGESVATCNFDLSKSMWGCQGSPPGALPPAPPYPELVSDGTGLPLHRVGIWGYSAQDALDAYGDGLVENRWPSQLEEVEGAGRLVTGALGINDFHFGDPLHWAWQYRTGQAESHAHDHLAEIDAAINKMFASLEVAQQNGAQVVVTLYYNPYAPDEFGNGDNGGDGCGTTHGISDLITGVINDKLRQKAQEHGFLVADFKTKFEGHGAGTSDPWVVGTSCDLSGALQAAVPDWNQSEDDGGAGVEQRFDPHPNAKGTAAMAQTILDALEG